MELDWDVLLFWFSLLLFKASKTLFVSGNLSLRRMLWRFLIISLSASFLVSFINLNLKVKIDYNKYIRKQLDISHLSEINSLFIIRGSDLKLLR